ncbi:hypothetical protein ACFX2B_044819 [Malus domestica]
MKRRSPSRMLTSAYLTSLSTFPIIVLVLLIMSLSLSIRLQKSSIVGLEKLRLLDHSLELQAIIEHTPACPICMEPLDCLDAEEDDEEEEARPQEKEAVDNDHARMRMITC